MSTKYFIDDSRLEAVSDLDLTKTWSQLSDIDKFNTINKRYNIIKEWYNEHKSFADSKKGREFTLSEHEKAFNYLRRQYLKNNK